MTLWVKNNFLEKTPPPNFQQLRSEKVDKFVLKYYGLWMYSMRIWLRSIHIDVASG